MVLAAIFCLMQFVHPQPWLLEHELIQVKSLPLNLQGNQAHPYHKELSLIRYEQKQKAKELPVMERLNDLRPTGSICVNTTL